MVTRRAPTPELLRAFLAAQGTRDFSYTALGATRGEFPPGFVVDRRRVALGKGEDLFLRAQTVLQRWGQFDLGWVEAWPNDTPIRVGEVVAVVARLFGLWWLSACRIVYVVDEPATDPGSTARFGFAYGTLPDHAGVGEERFLIEWDRATDEVWYDIVAFSRPQWLVTRVGYPYMRRMQKRFGRDSTAAMLRAVQAEPGAAGSWV